MVGHDDPGDAVVHRQPRVLGVEHALDQHRKLGLRPQPGDVVPVQPGRHDDLADMAGVAAAAVLPQVAQVLHGQPGRQVVEVVAVVAVAAAEHRRVDGDDERLDAGCFGPAHDRLGELQVRLQVELEPQARVGRDLAGRRGDVLDRRGRGHADDHDRARAGRGACGGELAVGVREPVERRGRDEDLQLLMDLIPCHTSIEHPSFRAHPDRYIWADGDRPPNNWVASFGAPPGRATSPRPLVPALLAPQRPDPDSAGRPPRSRPRCARSSPAGAHT